MDELTKEIIGKVGQKRRFSFSQEEYEIKKVVENLDLEFEWNWGQLSCPHCNQMIKNIKKHKIIRAEILKNSKDYVVLVDTEDGKKMLPPLNIKDKILIEYKGE